jgi:hypothetical protein
MFTMKFPIVTINILDYLPWHLDAPADLERTLTNSIVLLDDSRRESTAIQHGTTTESYGVSVSLKSSWYGYMCAVAPLSINQSVVDVTTGNSSFVFGWVVRISLALLGPNLDLTPL